VGGVGRSHRWSRDATTRIAYPTIGRDVTPAGALSDGTGQMNAIRALGVGTSIAAGIGVGGGIAFQAWKRTSRATDQPVASVGADALTAAAFLGLARVAGRSSLHFAGTPALKAGLYAAAAAAAAMTVATAVVVNMEDSTGLMAGVYAPERLKLLAPDKVVTGTVIHIKREGDGDDHINIIPDPDSRWALAAHTSRFLLFKGPPQTELVTEETRTTRHLGKLPQVKVGDHVKIEGPWVDDLVHHWNEIHPVKQIEVLDRAQ
jgi:hypothetical protein